MKYLKTFEKYVDPQPTNFSELFGFSDEDLGMVLAEFTDKFPFIEREITSNNQNSFKIELFDSELENDPTQDLKDEFKFFQQKIQATLKDFLNDVNLRIDSVSYNQSRNRIVIAVSKIKVA